MPTYRNDTGEPRSDGGVSWRPGEIRSVLFFVPSSKGLTMTSAAPAVPGLLLAGSGNHTVAAGVDLVVPLGEPVKSTSIMLSVQCRSGDVGVKLGDETSNVAELHAGDCYVSPEKGTPWGRANRITLTSAGGAEISVIVEEVG